MTIRPGSLDDCSTHQGDCYSDKVFWGPPKTAPRGPDGQKGFSVRKSVAHLLRGPEVVVEKPTFLRSLDYLSSTQGSPGRAILVSSQPDPDLQFAEQAGNLLELISALEACDASCGKPKKCKICKVRLCNEHGETILTLSRFS